MAPYVIAQRRGLGLILLLTVVLAGAAAMQPLPIVLLIDFGLGDSTLPEKFESALEHVVPGQRDVAIVVLAAAASIAVFLLAGFAEAATTRLWARVGQGMVYDLSADVFNRLQRLSLAYHGKRNVGDLLARLSDDTWCVYAATEGVLITPIRSLLTLGTIGVVAWRLDPVLTGVCLVITPPLAVWALFVGPRLRQRAKATRVAQARLTAFVHQALIAIPVVQSYDAADRNLRHFNGLARSAVRTSQANVALKNAFISTNGLFMAVGTALVLFVGSRRVMENILTLGVLVAFLHYLGAMKGSFQSLLKTYGELKSAEAGLDRVLEVLDAQEDVPESSCAIELPIAPKRDRVSIRLQDVTFGYDPNRPVLRSMNLDVEAGQTVALVGPTGSGKTTLVSLIPRMFDPQAGRVLFDGHDVRDLTLLSLRTQIAMVLQDALLLPLTVAENIAYGVPGADRRDIEVVAKAARADGFIRRLPQGYDTPIAERGVTLSGGQKQRLAIARALLKDAPLVILDEPTASLDVQTESDVLTAIKELISDRTTLIIAHRLSTIRAADHIALLDDGRIVESGTHTELYEAHGRYRRFCELQFPSESHGAGT